MREADLDDSLPFPRLAARTRNFSLGQPRTVSVSRDGRRVAFLRSAGPTEPVHALWVLDVDTGSERLVADPDALLGAGGEDLPAAERALRERRREASGGIVAYACDEAGLACVFTLSGRLFRARLDESGVEPAATELPVAGPVLDPRLSPAGDRVAYVSDGALRVLEVADPAGTDRVLAAEEGISWGVAEFVAAEEMNRFRGHWWAPDGTRVLAARVDESPVPVWHLADPADPAAPGTQVRYPYAGAENALVTLEVIDVEGGKHTEVRWDRDAHEYLVTAGWDDSGCVLLTVMDRRQTRARVLGADPATGEVSEHHAATASPWLEVLPGTPELLPDGRLVWSSDDATADDDTADDGTADDGAPAGGARRLLVGGVPVTPPDLYVRGYLGRSGDDLLVEGTRGAPEQNHVYRLAPDGALTPLTTARGWHGAVVSDTTSVTIARSLDSAGATFTVRAAGGTTHRLASHAATPPYAPDPGLTRVGPRRLPAGVVYPAGHRRGTRLPVLADPYAGPHHQEVVAARSLWQERQWWADQGFAVVVVDGRGTPGVDPAFEHAIRLDVAGPVLDDQVDALTALAADQPDLDLSRVGIRGWSFGGWLAALAVLRRPDVFHAAVAGAPVTDWGLYDTFYTERYLGLPDEHPEAYVGSSLLDDAARLTRPLMLIHGLADDNVVAAHTLRLSGALLSAGRPHQVLPLSGVTHMASGETVAENLLLLQLDFLRGALAR